jgi:hypothetical protein
MYFCGSFQSYLDDAGFSVEEKTRLILKALYTPKGVIIPKRLLRDKDMLFFNVKTDLSIHVSFDEFTHEISVYEQYQDQTKFILKVFL